MILEPYKPYHALIFGIINFIMLLFKSIQGLSYPNPLVTYYDAFFSWMDIKDHFEKTLHMVVETQTKKMKKKL
jgi:hypothetical protein